MQSHRNTDSAEPPAPDDPGSTAPAPPATTDPVLLAARSVLMDLGPRRATLTEVARRAGVSRMTVYRRFETWDRVVSALLTVELARLISDADEQSRRARSARERTVAGAVSMTSALSRHELFRKIIEIDPESLTPLMTVRFGQTQRAAIDHLARLLTEGIPRLGGDGSVRDTDPNVLATSCLLLCQSFVFSAATLDSLPEGEQVREQLPTMLDTYLAPPADTNRPPAGTNRPRADTNSPRADTNKEDLP